MNSIGWFLLGYIAVLIVSFGLFVALCVAANAVLGWVLS